MASPHEQPAPFHAKPHIHLSGTNEQASNGQLPQTFPAYQTLSALMRISSGCAKGAVARMAARSVSGAPRRRSMTSTLREGIASEGSSAAACWDGEELGVGRVQLIRRLAAVQRLSAVPKPGGKVQAERRAWLSPPRRVLSVDKGAGGQGAQPAAVQVVAELLRGRGGGQALR